MTWRGTITLYDLRRYCAYFLPGVLELVHHRRVLVGRALRRRLPTEELLLELMVVMIGKVVGEGVIESCRVIGRRTEHRAHTSGTPVTV